VSILDEKLAGVDRVLADLGRSDEEVAAVRGRFADVGRVDLEAVDAELGALSEDVEVERPPSTTQDPSEPVSADTQSWDDEETEVEILDESDFVLLVDEDDLEELEKVGEDDAVKTTPPRLPGDDEDDGFFKKLFGGRRSRPPQP
jgi:hypothetical protein